MSGLLCTPSSIDITDRKRAEKEAQWSEARMRGITDSAQDAIIMIDPQGAISFWNPAAESSWATEPKKP